MRTIDLDELWNAQHQILGKTASGITASGTIASARALHHDRPDIRGHLAADAERTAPRISINDLAAIRMPDVDFKPEVAPYGLRDRLLRFDGFMKSFDTTAAVWLSMGFISGMIAWHSVGFWGFVTDAVLQPGDRDYKISASAQPPILEQPPASTPPPPLTTGSLPDKNSVDLTACVMLAIDRVSSQTLAEPCSRPGTQMRDAGRGKRSDRIAGVHEHLQAPQAWTAEAEAAPADASQVNGAADTPEFDLTLSPE